MKKILVAIAVTLLLSATARAQSNPCINQSGTNCTTASGPPLALTQPDSALPCGTNVSVTVEPTLGLAGLEQVWTTYEDCVVDMTNYPLPASSITLLWWTNTTGNPNSGVGTNAVFSATNGNGILTFHLTYSNYCGGSTTVSQSFNYTVFTVASLAPTGNANCTQIFSNATEQIYTIPVSTNPAVTSLEIVATPYPYQNPLPPCWSLNGQATTTAYVGITNPGVHTVICSIGNSAMTNIICVTQNGDVEQGCPANGPAILGYWSFNSPTNALIDWWSANSDSNNVVYDSIGTNNGTFHSDLYSGFSGTNIDYSTVSSNQGFLFDGIGSYITFNTNAGNFGTNDFTIDFSVESTGTSSYGASTPLLTKNCAGGAGQWSMGLNYDGTVNISVSGLNDTCAVSFNSRAVIDNGLFHEITLQRMGPAVTLFIDGNPDTAVTASGIANLANTSPLMAACNPSMAGYQTSYPFIMEEIKFYKGVVDSWSGSDSPWVGNYGQQPLNDYGLQNPASPWGNALQVDNAGSNANLSYNYMENDGSPNINCINGAVSFWFKPDWNGGQGPGMNGRMVELGNAGSTDGLWSLWVDAYGTTLSFQTRSNGVATTYLTQSITNWTSNDWYQVVLNYSPEATQLYINGVLAQTNTGLVSYPSISNRMQYGFNIGSRYTGLQQVRGCIDELYTVNCPLTAQQVATGFPGYPGYYGVCMWDTTGSMTNARSGQTATLLPNGLALIAGGDASGTNAELYNPGTGTWAATGSLNIPRSGQAATLLCNGQVLVVGGDSSGTSAELYNPANGKWTVTGSMNIGRSAFTATSLPNGQVLVAGGDCYYNNEDTFGDAELYDPSTGQWTLTGSLNNPRYSHTATLLSNGLVYVTGGYGVTGITYRLFYNEYWYGFESSGELYDPSSGTWRNTGGMSHARQEHTATLLTNGQVLIAGGYNWDDGYVATTELYDPVAGACANSGALNYPRNDHTATLLPNGQVLVAGGNGMVQYLQSTIIPNAELFDPAAAEWTNTCSLNNDRFNHTATLLTNGFVLVAGGTGSNGVLAGAELYTTGSGSNDAPLILIQPVSQAALPGTNVTFSVTAIGAQPLSYQWYFDGAGLLAGATNASLTLANVQAANLGNYSVVVANAAGSTISSIASLTWMLPPEITIQPASQTVVQGANVTFSVTVAGTSPLSYQWQFGGVNLAGATNSSFITNNVQSTSAGAYDVVASNPAGSVTSETAVLTVNVPISITTQPASQTNVLGSNATFSVTANGTLPLSYQWYFDGAAIPGATSSTYTQLVLQSSNAGNYSVLVTNIDGSVTSSNAVLIVTNIVSVPPFITSYPADVVTNVSSNASFSIAVSNISPTNFGYQWYLNGTNVIPNETNSTLDISDVQATNVGFYTVVVSNSAGTASASATLTVTMFSSNWLYTNDLKLNLNATNTITNAITLTPAVNDKAGSAFLTEPILLASNASFSTCFSFRLSKGGGDTTDPADGIYGADGIVFVVQTLTNNVGTNGGGMGYGYLTNSVGIEFDTYWNSGTNTQGPTFDPGLPPGLTNANGTTNDGNHIGIDFNGFMTNSVTIKYGVTNEWRSAAWQHVTNIMNDSNVWYAWIDYNGATSNLEVRLAETNSNRPSTPLLVYSNINLLDFLTVGGKTNAYLGFTGATGGTHNQQDILSWQFFSPYHPIGLSNEGPTVVMVSPTNGAVLVSNAPVLLLAGTTEASGMISNVQFFDGTNGTNLLGTATEVGCSTNYAFAWTTTNVLLGTNTIQVWAQDTNGFSNSATVSVIVDSAPVVSAGSNQVAIFTNTSVTITLNGSASGGYGSLTTLWTQVAGPANASFTNTALPNTAVTFTTNGIYVLQLTASDGFLSSSSQCTVTLKRPPSISITLPANNAIISLGEPIFIEATASDLDGVVTNVQFFNGANLLQTISGESTAYGMTWYNAPDGTNILTAVATGSEGLSITSAAVAVIVNSAPVVSAGPDITTNWTGSGSVTVTLNGSVTDDGLPYQKTNLSWSVVSSNGTVRFTNATQAVATATFTTNGVFVLQLRGDDGWATNTSTCKVTILRNPFISIVSPTNSSTFSPGAPITNVAVAYDVNGLVTNVQFFDCGTNNLGTATVSNTTNYTLIWTTAPPGSNSLFAVATDTNGLTTTSASVGITVTSFSTMSISITNPSPNTVFLAPAQIQITATNSSAVHLVNFFASNNLTTNLIGRDIVDTANPYSCVWTGGQPGNYTLTAQSVDQSGHAAMSPGVLIQIAQPISVNAGSNVIVILTNTSATISLNGIVTGGCGNCGSITSLWTQVDGPAPVQFGNTTNTNTTVTLTNVLGDYTLRLAANDSYSQGSGTVTIMLLSNLPPVVNAGPNRIIGTNDPAFLNGSVTEADLPSPPSLAIWWSEISGPTNTAAVTFSDVTSPTNTATGFTNLGVYTLCLTASNLLGVTTNTMTVSVVDPSSRTYTWDADFAEGELVNVNFHDVPNQLQLNHTITPFPFVWVACSARSTIVRIDANTGQILGEYKTVPQSRGSGSPSRTTVDRNGNVWVANRCDNNNNDPQTNGWPGSVTRVGIVIGGTRGDKIANGNGGFTFSPNRNGEYLQPPFKYCTAIDRDGDGLIRTSRGLGDMLGWGASTNHSNDLGGVSLADDECIINYTRVASYGTRTMAIDANNNLWVGGQTGTGCDGNQWHQQVDGITGLPIPNTAFSAGHGGYGGLIDGKGALWSAHDLMRFDINRRFNMTTPLPTIIEPNYVGDSVSVGSYGVGIDPNTGYIWCSDGSQVHRVSPDASQIDSFTNPDGSGAGGIAVDDFGNVWVASHNGGNYVAHFRTDGTFVGNVDLGCATYYNNTNIPGYSAPQGVNGPTGVAIDANGKVWATCQNSDKAMRINPILGPRVLKDALNPAGYLLGDVDLIVNLDTDQQQSNSMKAAPYNYSDMTGFVSIGATEPSGIWQVVHDSRITNEQWGVVQWDSSEPTGTAIKVEVRAADAYAQLHTATNLFFQVASNVLFSNNIRGRFIEIRTTFTAQSGTGVTPVLYDLTVSSTNPVVVATAADFANSDYAVMLENGAPLVIDVLSNDVAPPGTNLTLTSVSPASSGTVVITNATNVLYAPNTNFYGVDQFSYTATDNQGGIGRAVVTVEVGQAFPAAATNLVPPMASNISVAVPGNSVKYPIDVLDVCSDKNGPHLSDPRVYLHSFTQAAHGYVQRSGCDMLYTPNVGYVGADSFTYTIRNAAGLTDTATVSITNTGQAPILMACNTTNNGAISTNNSAHSLYSDYGSSGGGLFANTYIFAGVPNDAVTVTVTNGSGAHWFLYNPDANATNQKSGNDSFTISATSTNFYVIEVSCDADRLSDSSNYSLSISCGTASLSHMAVLLNTNWTVPDGGGIDFGVTSVGSSIPAYLTLSNYGNATLTVTSYGFNPDNGYFVVTDTPLTNGSIDILPGGCSTLTVWFEGLQEGRTNETIRFADNDTTQNNYFTINLTAIANATNTMPPTGVAITNPETNATFMTSNTWADSGTISITATATPAAGASIWAVDIYALGTNGNIPIAQVFTPDENGNYTSNWSDPPPGSYNLTAVAIDNSGLETVSAPVPITVIHSPVMEVFWGTNNLLDGSTIDLGTVAYGPAQPYQVVLTVTNAGPGTLRITSCGFSSYDGGPIQWAVTNNPVTQTIYLDTNQSTNVTVTFAATEYGMQGRGLYSDGNDCLRIQCDDWLLNAPNGEESHLPTAGLFGISFRATVVAPGTNNETIAISYPASSATFIASSGNTIDAYVTDPDSDNVSVEFYATNSFGTNFLGLGSQGRQGNDNSGDYSCSWSLAVPGQYWLVAVGYDSYKEVSFVSSAVPITVVTRPTNSPIMEVFLSQTNLLPNYVTIDDGLTNVGTPVTNALTISNAGNAVLSIVNYVLSDTTNFTCNWDLPIFISPGSSSNLCLVYNSINPGRVAGVLTIYDNDVASDPFYITNTASANPLNGTAPTAQLTTPANGAMYAFPTEISLGAVASCPSNSTLAAINFYASGPFGSVQVGQALPAAGQTNFTGGAAWSQPMPGTYALSAVAVDHSGLMGQSTNVVVIQVINPNGGFTNAPGSNAPIARDDQLIVQGVVSNQFTYPINVLANDSSPNGYPLTIVSLVYTGKLGTLVLTNNELLFTPLPLQYGTEYALYTVYDGRGGMAAAQVQIVVVKAELPTIQWVTPTDGEYIDLGTNPTNRVLSLVVNAQGSINNAATNKIVLVRFYEDGQLFGAVTTGSNNLFTNRWLTPAAGQYNLVAIVLDNVGQEQITSNITITIAGNTNDTPPTAKITNLQPTTNSLNGMPSLVYPLITNGFINVTGTACATGRNASNDVVSYQLLLQNPDGTVVANVTQGFDTNSGFCAGAVTNGVLASNVDLSLCQNGVYDIVLNVYDGWLMSTASARILLNSQLKIGNFSFSVQDVALPVSGMPFTVTRTYNSFNLNQADFGYSWTYTLNDLNIQFDEMRQDTPDIDGNIFSLRVGGGRDVTLTLPDGRTVTFQFSFQKDDDYSYRACYQAPPGVNYTLTAVDNGPRGYPYYDAINNCWDSEGGTGFESFDFQGFILKAPDGTQYFINRAYTTDYIYASGANGDFSDNEDYVAPYGAATLTEIDEPNGDKIKISGDRIDHYNTNGALTRTIRFQRDGQNRIIGILDPNAVSNEVPVMTYDYDANGNLANVGKLNAQGSYDITSYQYTNTQFPHFMTGIIDPLRIPVAENIYDPSGRLIEVDDANGNKTLFIHNTTNDMDIVVDKLGFGLTNYYDLCGNITNTVNALGQTNAFTYDNNNYLLQSVDALGHTNAYGYDTNGYCTAITNALGQATHFTFDNGGHLLCKTNALTNTTSFTYDSAGHRTAVVDQLGNPTTFGHDLFGRPNTVTNALGQLRATAGSDSSGNLQFVSQVGGLQMNFGHDLNGNTTNANFAWINPNNTNQTRILSTITQLDPANRVTRVTDPDGQSRVTIYDADGRVAQNIDRMGNTNSYLYDGMGNLIQTTYPDYSITRSVFDARNQVIYTDDRHLDAIAVNGTHNVYDPLGRVMLSQRLADVQIAIVYSNGIPGSVLSSAGAVLCESSTAYDAAGRVLATTNALGYVTQYEYDAAGRQTAIIDALTNRTDNAYDGAGQLRFTTNALNGVTEYQYDAKGRRIKTIFPDNSYITNAYNQIGQLMFVKDQAGLETDYQYDNLGRMTNVTEPLVFNPETGSNTNPQYGYMYDAYGNILSIRDPKGRQIQFTYDALGEALGRSLPLLQSNGFSYNGLGQLNCSVDFMGQSNCFVYDSLGRVATNLVYAAGAAVPSQTNVFIYDFNGRLFETIRPDGITYRQYDLNGAVTNIVSPEGWISYEYDPQMGCLTRAYTTNSDIRYGYDQLGRLGTVSVIKRDGVTLPAPETTTNTYTKLGSLQNIFLPNGAWTVYQYDVMNHLTNMAHYKGANQLLAQYQYTVASDGTRLASTETRLESGGGYSTTAISWSNDALHRLVRETGSSTVAALNYTNNYVYDVAGNRLWKTNVSGAGIQVTGYTYNANDQLLVESNSAGAMTNYYDSNGSLTNRSSASETNLYTYNLEGRLAGAVIKRTEAGQLIRQTNNYNYNESGIRVREEMTGSVNATNIFLNDPQNLSGFSQVLEEMPEAGAAPTASYTIGSQVMAQEAGGTVSFLMPDGHGSTRLLTDSGGAISDRYSYDGYGMALDFTFGTLNPPRTALLYSGERFEPDLQQYYMLARNYTPGNGRFAAQDQVDGTPSAPLTLHKYAYTQNNPVNMRDPSGNDGDLISTLEAISIGMSLDAHYNAEVLKAGYVAAVKVTEIGQSFNSTVDAASRDASPGVDTATIIVHGVGPEHTDGWSLPFQNALTAPANAQVGGPPLNHDFYEFDWGGFSINNSVPLTLYPIRSVHEMALVQLQMEENLVQMNGYARIDVISHSWGTTLTYDLQQTSGIETHDWVTMGSVLKASTPKPSGVKGDWINFSSPFDPAYFAALYPPFPDNLVSLNSLGPNVHSDPLVDVPQIHHMGHWGIPEHGAYWQDPYVLSMLRLLLQ